MSAGRTEERKIGLEVALDVAQMRHMLERVPVVPVVPVAPTAHDDLFQTTEWFEHLAAHGFDRPVQAWLPCVLEVGAAPSLGLPLMASPAGLRSLSNYYSSLYGPAGWADPPGASADAAAWALLAQALRSHPQGAVIDLQPLAADAVWVGQLSAAVRRAGYRVDRYFCFGNWYLPTAGGGYEAYLAARPSALRNSIQRGQRRLQRTDQHALVIHHQPGPALDAAVAAFEAVYQRSWKEPEPCPQFMPGLIRMAAEHGWLRLGVLELEGVPVAAQVWLVKGGKANIYKLAYVQGYERFSPGSVLTAALMRHVMDVDQVREVDYLTGDDAYKRDWMSHRRERIGLVAFDLRRPQGLLAAARHYGGKGWRRLRGAVATRPAPQPQTPAGPASPAP